MSFLINFIGLTIFISSIIENANASFNGPFQAFQGLMLMTILFSLTLILKDK